MTNNLLIIGLESANSFSKSFSNAKPEGFGLKYYNTATEINGKQEGIAANVLSNVYTVRVNGRDRRYKVGRAEGETSSGQSNLKYNEQYKIETLITIYQHLEASKNQDSVAQVVAVIGLPTVHYRNQTTERQIEELFLDEEHVVNGRTFKIIDLDFFLQPLGTFYSLIFNYKTLELTKLADKLLDPSYKFLVSDCGFGTRDETVVQGSEKVDETSSKKAMGHTVGKIKQRAIEEINDDFRLCEITLLEIDEQIQKQKDTEKIMIGKGKYKVDVTKIVDEEFADLAASIIKGMDVPGHAFDDFENIIITGGTSIAVRKYLEKYDDGRFLFVDDLLAETEEKKKSLLTRVQVEQTAVTNDAQMANAIGYYIQACSNAEDVLEKA